MSPRSRERSAGQRSAEWTGQTSSSVDLRFLFAAGLSCSTVLRCDVNRFSGLRNCRGGNLGHCSN